MDSPTYLYVKKTPHSTFDHLPDEVALKNNPLGYLIFDVKTIHQYSVKRKGKEMFNVQQEEVWSIKRHIVQ